MWKKCTIRKLRRSWRNCWRWQFACLLCSGWRHRSIPCECFECSVINSFAGEHSEFVLLWNVCICTPIKCSSFTDWPARISVHHSKCHSLLCCVPFECNRFHGQWTKWMKLWNTKLTYIYIFILNFDLLDLAIFMWVEGGTKEARESTKILGTYLNFLKIVAERESKQSKIWFLSRFGK